MTKVNKLDAISENDKIKEELIDINIPIPYKLNSRVHSEENIKGIMASISAHGLDKAISLDKNMVIICGHGRLEACKRLGMRVIRARIRTDLNKQQANELRIADNKVASTEVDSALMKLELEEIDLTSLDASILGFTAAELEKFTMTYDELDVSAFTEDLNKDVDIQAKEAEHDIKKADLKLVPVTGALGFKVVTVDATRKIARFVASLQDQYELEDPAQAFIRFIEDMEVA